MTEEEKAEEKYCKNCKLRQEQCLWAWRKTNGLDMPNNQNCSCKEVPAYIAGATEATKELEAQLTEKDKQIEELEGQVTRAFEVLESKRKQIEELQSKVNNYHTWVDKIKELKCVRLGKCTHEQERLETQIEKMKCCYNCANDTLEPPEVIGNGICEHCKNHDKWELAN